MWICLDEYIMWNGMEIHEFISLMESGKIEIPEKWNKRYGSWHYGAIDVLNGETHLLKGMNFKILENVEMYLDKSVGKYVPWESYKLNFEKNLILINSDTLKSHEFEFVATFRKQDSQSWEGAGAGFENNLKKLGIRWFVYIKFYIDRNLQNKMLVCGKSGSLLVNQYGTDLDFGEWNGIDKTSKNNTPARRFLYETGLHWNKTQIAIKRCEGEREALELEKYYIRLFGLMNS